jgi:GAF domain-containing protein
MSGFRRTARPSITRGKTHVRVTNEPAVTDGFQAITSLSRALGGRVELNDVGSLLWVVLRQMVPCDTMAIFVPSASGAQVAVRYAAGAHADKLKGIRRPISWGIAGWVAANRRSVVNAEPIFDLGFRVAAGPELRSSVTVPLVDNGRVVAVLALYSKDLLAFTDEQATLLELLGARLALSLADAATSQMLPAPDRRAGLHLVERTT